MMRRFAMLLCSAVLIAACSGSDGAPLGESEDVGDTSSSGAPSSPDERVEQPAPSTSAGIDSSTSNQDPPESGPPVEVCSLMSPAEVEDFLGGPASGFDSGSAIFFGCRWDNGILAATLEVLSFVDAPTAAASFAASAGDSDPIDEFGDPARSSIINDISFLRGPFVVNVIIAGSASDEAQRQLARDIALLVIPRLDGIGSEG